MLKLCLECCEEKNVRLKEEKRTQIFQNKEVTY